MKPSDTVREGSDEHDKYINHRLAELKDILRRIAESFFRFLFAGHSGGILAMAVLVKMRPTGFDVLSKLALSSFSFGLVLTAAMVLHMLFRVHTIDKEWVKNTDLWYDGDINWGELNRRDELLTKSDKIEFVFALISFLCFILGALFGALEVWCGNG